MVYCLDAATGALVWEHDTYAAIWGSFLLAGDRLYVGNEDGTMTILRTGRRKDLLGEIEMDGALYSLPSLIGDALWLTTSTAVVPDRDKALNPADGRLSSWASSMTLRRGCSRGDTRLYTRTTSPTSCAPRSGFGDAGGVHQVQG